MPFTFYSSFSLQVYKLVQVLLCINVLANVQWSSVILSCWRVRLVALLWLAVGEGWHLLGHPTGWPWGTSWVHFSLFGLGLAGFLTLNPGATSCLLRLGRPAGDQHLVNAGGGAFCPAFCSFSVLSTGKALAVYNWKPLISAPCDLIDVKITLWSVKHEYLCFTFSG